MHARMYLTISIYARTLPIEF